MRTTKGGKQMAKTEAQMRATKKYVAKAYYRPSIMLRREYEELLRQKAEVKGLSVSGYIVELIKKDLGITDTKKDTD